MTTSAGQTSPSSSSTPESLGQNGSDREVLLEARDLKKWFPVTKGLLISCQPSVLIADEPTTSLDVTIQAQYLKLLKELQRESNLGLIFITHDFGIVAKMCDKVAVMYAGKIVEQGSVRDIFNHPSHPYTEALLASVPKLEEDVDRLYSIEGQPPALHDLPPGCPFAPCCQYVMEQCREEYPPVLPVNEGHSAACWRLA